MFNRYDYDDEERNENNGFKIGIVILSLISVCFYIGKQCYLKKNHQQLYSWPKIIAEILILCIMPIPYTEKIFVADNKPNSVEDTVNRLTIEERNTQYLSDIISAFMLLRLYFLFKVVMYPQKNDLLNIKQFTNNCEPSIWLSFKIKLLKHSEITIFLMFLVSIFVFSFLILLFDLETFIDYTDHGTDNPMFLATYQIVITITSVGYGDFSPKSAIGRFVIMFCSIWGAVLISFIVLVVSNVFSLSEDQETALKKL